MLTKTEWNAVKKRIVLQENQLEYLSRVLVGGESITTVADDVGISRQMIHKAVNRVLREAKLEHYATLIPAGTTSKVDAFVAKLKKTT